MPTAESGQLAVHPNTERIAAKVLDGEAVIIDLMTGTYYSLTGAGSRFWEHVEAGSPVADAASAIAAEYNVAAERVRQDLDALIGLLRTEQLVVDGVPRAAVALPAASPVAVYESPELQVFRDMQDLLALDPPMPGLEDVRQR